MEGEGHGFRDPEPTVEYRLIERFYRAGADRRRRAGDVARLATGRARPVACAHADRDPRRRRGRERVDATPSAARTPIDFDPYDPDQVKVHYNLTGWSFDQRAELAETLADAGLPHAWEGDELVVPEADRERRRRAVRRARARDRPVPGRARRRRRRHRVRARRMAGGRHRACSSSRCSRPRSRTAGGPALFVATDAEQVVDDLLDAIEAGERRRRPRRREAPDGALQHVRGGRPARQATRRRHGPQRRCSISPLSSTPTQPPFGVAPRAWSADRRSRPGRSSPTATTAERRRAE